MRKWMIILASLVVLSGAVGLYVTRQGQEVKLEQRYSCPMHPSVVDNKPSNCPICGMRLELVADSARKQADKSTVPGMATVSISPKTQQLMGVTFGRTEKRKLKKIIRTSARILPDESRISRITTKVDGWVGRLNVSVTGQSVKKDDPLLSIYSQELLVTEQEYLDALKNSRNASGPAKDSADSLVAAAKRRLQLWDISDDQISRIENTGQPDKEMIIKSPVSGVVLEKNVLSGQKISSGDALFVIADLSSVWADAAVHEPDIIFIKDGMPVSVTLASFSGRSFNGKVSFLSPSIDPATRTMTARLEIPNGDMMLKPEMYADAEFTAEIGEKLSIPESAVMFTGLRSIAFMEDESDDLVPVEVKLGVRADGYYEVLSGIGEFERVVTSANFLIDSESSRKAAVDAMSKFK